VSGHHLGDISTGFKCRAESKAFQRVVNLAELVLRSVALAAPTVVSWNQVANLIRTISCPFLMRAHKK